MAARIYSVRFLAGRSTGVTQTYTVPGDRRAVARHLIVQTFVSAPNSVTLSVDGVPIIYLATPPAPHTYLYDLRAVAYPGETMTIQVAGGDAAWHLSGFLFADTGTS